MKSRITKSNEIEWPWLVLFPSGYCAWTKTFEIACVVAWIGDPTNAPV